VEAGTEPAPFHDMWPIAGNGASTAAAKLLFHARDKVIANDTQDPTHLDRQRRREMI